jgi:hypothetical protein
VSNETDRAWLAEMKRSNDALAEVCRERDRLRARVFELEEAQQERDELRAAVQAWQTAGGEVIGNDRRSPPTADQVTYCAKGLHRAIINLDIERKQERAAREAAEHRATAYRRALLEANRRRPEDRTRDEARERPGPDAKTVGDLIGLRRMPED